ncbi:hypothetical protein, partial [Providencia sp. PROV202]|uniref:hypothetical protein n=1 Tax=Providencia sp. PROV202 TaxID=2949902 RepID=UPI002349D4A0
MAVGFQLNMQGNFIADSKNTVYGLGSKAILGAFRQLLVGGITDFANGKTVSGIPFGDFQYSK